MKVAIVSANLGGYDVPAAWPDLQAPEGVTVDVHRLNDETFPPRPLAMTSRLQCGIPKWFGWQLFPSYDVYIWIDASCAPTPTAVSWFLQRLAGASVAVFQHPERKSIREEHAFMKARMARPGETYLNSRYAGEWLDEQFAALERAGLRDLPLYASTAFAYRPSERVTRALSEVFLSKARYLLHDQLAFPAALHRHGCVVNTIADNYMKCDALTFTRQRQLRRRAS